MKETDFAALLCSRLCHDLISPVGALSNGIEILADEDDDEMRGEVLKLLEQSARQTASRLQFFRLAFGAAGGFGEKVDLREVERVVQAFFDDSKTILNWQTQLVSLRKESVRILMNLLLIVAEVMVRGGALQVGIRQTDDRVSLDLEVNADRIVINEKVMKALDGSLVEEDIDPKAATGHLAYLTAAAMESGISVQTDGTTRMSVTAELPA